MHTVRVPEWLFGPPASWPPDAASGGHSSPQMAHSDEPTRRAQRHRRDEEATVRRLTELTIRWGIEPPYVGLVASVRSKVR